MDRDNAIQNTMLIPLWNRAHASRLFPEILTDSQAIDIVEHLDYDFSSIAGAFHEFAAMSHLVRAKGMEDAVLAYTSQHPRAAVVNIGAGLDTGFSRVDNGLLRWFDLDLPDALNFRNRFIPKQERVCQIAKSVFDSSWYEDIDFSEKEGAIFLAAGVFYFFREQEIRELLIDMAGTFPGGELVFDANSSEALAISNQMMQQSGNPGAMMYFSVDDPAIFESWSPKITLQYAGSRFREIPRLPQMSEEMLQNMQLCDEGNRILQIHLRFRP